MIVDGESGGRRDEGRRACPLCGGHEVRGEFCGLEVRYRVCSLCGSASAEGFPAFAEHYREYFPEFLRQDNPALEPRYDIVLQRLARLAPSRSLLEVGCGNGQFLDQARRMGWSVYGTELSVAQVEHCRKRGLDVELGDLQAQGLFRGRTFGAVVLIEVLEHLPDPVGMLQEAALRAIKGGVLYLTTPHWGSLSRRLLRANWSVLDPEHVVLATVGGLTRALERAGWKPISVGARNLNPLEFLRFGGRAWRRRGVDAKDGTALAAGHVRTRAEDTEALRRRIQGSFPLRVGKEVANLFLGWTRLGDTLVAWARRA